MNPSKFTPLDVQVMMWILCERPHYRAIPAWRDVFHLFSSDVSEKFQFQSDKVWGKAENSARLENNFLLCSSILLIQMSGN